MIKAGVSERPAIEAFLTDNIATSMFPLSNLRSYGMNGGHPRAVTFWVRWQAGQITDVLTITDGGFLFPQCPTAPWADVRVILGGQRIQGILGDAQQANAIRDACDLVTPEMNDVDPLYHVSLRDLQVPDCRGYRLVSIADAPRDVVTAWREDYLNTVLAIPGTDPQKQAQTDIAAYISADSHRVLMQGDTVLAMTGFNARLSHAVQVGGVYTPPEFRKQGLARRAVGLHLQEARSNGVTDAILFAASGNAARAYEAIGFQHIGAFALLIYKEPQVIHV